MSTLRNFRDDNNNDVSELLLYRLLIFFIYYYEKKCYFVKWHGTIYMSFINPVFISFLWEKDNLVTFIQHTHSALSFIWFLGHVSLEESRRWIRYQVKKFCFYFCLLYLNFVAHIWRFILHNFAFLCNYYTVWSNALLFEFCKLKLSNLN